MKKAALHNLGCKVNAYEAEAMRQMLEEAGYEIVPFTEKADVYVINTCSVTNVADKKSRQMLHRAKKLNPDSIVVAAGCYVQTAPEELQKDEAVDILIGNNRKKDLVQILEEYERRQARAMQTKGGVDTAEEKTAPCTGAEEAGGCRREGPGSGESSFSCADPVSGKEDSSKEAACGGDAGNDFSAESGGGNPQGRQDRFRLDVHEDLNRGEHGYEALRVSHPAEHTRAFVKVQDGCNQFCSYCIIPYARGRVRSRGISDVVREAESLAANGYREIVLTGIHLSSFGLDRGETLLDLIRGLNGISGIERIRLGSLEPGIITEEFVRELSRMPKVCPHFHLSLQSGSNTVLKRMNRKYTAEEYAARCALLREYYEHPALTTDLIVGFPGETDEEFAETLAFARRVHFYEIHVFKYSKREGTQAAAMAGQLAERVKAERSAALLEAAAEMKEEFIRWYIGKEVPVLFERAVDEPERKPADVSAEKPSEEREFLPGGAGCRAADAAEGKTGAGGEAAGQDAAAEAGAASKGNSGEIRYYEGFTPEYVKVVYPSGENLENRITVVEFSEDLY